jgi:hypothetical protein
VHNSGLADATHKLPQLSPRCRDSCGCICCDGFLHLVGLKINLRNNEIVSALRVLAHGKNCSLIHFAEVLLKFVNDFLPVEAISVEPSYLRNNLREKLLPFAHRLAVKFFLVLRHNNLMSNLSHFGNQTCEIVERYFVLNWILFQALVYPICLLRIKKHVADGDVVGKVIW